MELHEKLQELRKEKGITQEELAESLYVSRTAVSKWESGRGYPSIDSLKEIAKFYSVTVDELLSAEKIITIAERENKSNMAKTCNIFVGLTDVLAVLLIFLPLYPKPVGGYIYSVNLLGYEDLTLFNGAVYWSLFGMLTACGTVKILLALLKKERIQKILTIASISLSGIAVLFLAMAKEPYAGVLAFLLLSVKCIVILIKNKKE